MAEAITSPLATTPPDASSTDTKPAADLPLAPTSLKGYTSLQYAVGVELPTQLAHAKAVHAETLRVLAGG